MVDVPTIRLGFVECLRLLAATAVFAQHLAEHYPQIPALAALRAAGPGLLGVLIFFLVSGYVVPLSVRRGFAPLPFLLRRLFRIYPALLAAIALAVGLGASGVLPGWAWLAQADARTWAANLLLVQDYAGARPFLGVTWTLGVEFAWYALFAAGFARWGAGAALRLGYLFPALLLGCVAASLLLGLRLPLGRIGFLYACTLGFLTFYHESGCLSRRALIGHGLVFAAVQSVVALVEFGLFRHAALSLAQALWPALAAHMLFLGLILASRLRVAAPFARGVLPAAGSASYSVYLLHPLGLAIGGRFAAPCGAAAGIAISLAVTALLAFASYRLVELPGIALGRRLLTNGAVRPSARRAPAA